MQTFLPYPDIEKSLNSLDSKRLGKQRVEAYQILNILLNRISNFPLDFSLIFYHLSAKKVRNLFKFFKTSISLLNFQIFVKKHSYL